MDNRIQTREKRIADNSDKVERDGDLVPLCFRMTISSMAFDRINRFVSIGLLKCVQQSRKKIERREKEKEKKIEGVRMREK